MTNIRMTSVITAAVFFLLIGTFTSVTIQGAYQVIMVVPLAYYCWMAKGRSFRLPASAWILLAFSLVALISIILNFDIVPKPSKNLGRIKYFLMAAFGIFPIGVWLKTVSDRTKIRLMRWHFLSVIIAGLWIVYQSLTVSYRPHALTEDMRYAYGTGLTIVLGLGLILHYPRVRHWFSRRWGLLALIVALVAVYLMNSRGAQAAILLALPLIIWFWNRKVAIIVTVLFSLGGTGLVWNYFYGQQNQTKIRILDNSANASDEIRRSQWQAALIAVKERPVLGWGFSNFHTQLKRIKIDNNLAAQSYNDAHAHNVPLEIAAGTGLIGLTLFLAAFFMWWWECWKMGGLTRMIMMPFFVAISFQAQFEVILDANNATWISFLYTLTLAGDERYQVPTV